MAAKKPAKAPAKPEPKKKAPETPELVDEDGNPRVLSHRDAFNAN